jgi:signal transduction histidine kinase
MSATRRNLDVDDVALAAEFARRVSLGLDSRQLVSELRASLDDLARAQKELVRRERLAALGELAATVAHEVRNPLGAMANSVATLRRLLQPTGDAATLMTVLEEENSRLNRMVGDLLIFARPIEPTLRTIPISGIVEDALSAATRAQAEAPKIDIHWSVDPSTPDVSVDPRLLVMVFVNLFTNAFQAMPNGGRLRIAIRPMTVRGERWVEATIHDSGEGMAGEVMRRAFEPFFTTRASGTGLGLAIVKRIVEGHGGELRIDSETGEGTAIAVRLPRGAPESQTRRSE